MKYILESLKYSDFEVLGNEGIRLLTTKQHTAYVRIAEGCNNFCTYCIIPKIRGKFRSRLEKNILDEVNLLVNNGVKEIIKKKIKISKKIFNDKMIFAGSNCRQFLIITKTIMKMWKNQ